MTYFTFCPDCGFQEFDKKEEMQKMHASCAEICSVDFPDGAITYGEIMGRNINIKDLTLDQLTKMGFQITLSYHNTMRTEAVTELQNQCSSIFTNDYSSDTSSTGFAYVAQAGVAKLNGQTVEVNLYINEKGQNNE